MISQELLNSTDIVISYSVMKGSNTNRFGHAYLLFSYYCPQSKRMILDDAIGLNPSLVPKENTWRKKFSDVSYFDAGHLTQERYRFLIDDACSKKMNHYHKSWKVTPEQYLKILNKFQQERGPDMPLMSRNFEQEHEALLKIKKLTGEEKVAALIETKNKENEIDQRAQGPYFHLINHSCKTDALNRLADVGIDTIGMHNRLLDIPIRTGRMNHYEVSYDAKLKQVVWQTPLELSPQTTYENESEAMKGEILAQRQYHLLMSNLKEMIALFDLKLNDLAHQAGNTKTKSVIQTSRSQFAKILTLMLSEGKDPRHMTSENIQDYFMSYKLTIRDAKSELASFNSPQSNMGVFIQRMVDTFIELCTQLGQLISTANTVAYSEEYLLGKAEENMTQLAPRLRIC